YRLEFPAHLGNEMIRNLYKNCVDGNPANRPNFFRIIQMFETDYGHTLHLSEKEIKEKDRVNEIISFSNLPMYISNTAKSGQSMCVRVTEAIPDFGKSKQITQHLDKMFNLGFPI